MTFRFNYSMVLLTYKTHINKLEIRTHLETLSKLEIIIFEIAHEAPDKDDGGSPYEHTHIVMKWKKAVNFKNPLVFDYMGIHPHIKGINSMNKKQVKNTIRYLGKEDPDNAHLVKWTEDGESDESPAQGIQECESLNDAYIKFGAKMTSINIKGFYEAKPKINELKNEIEPEEFFKWQKDLHDEILYKAPNSRQIIWYYDKDGRCGKSSLCKYLYMNKISQYIRASGGIREIANQINNMVEDGWNQKCLIMDIPRTQEDNSFYGALEELQDGFITNTKFKGGNICMNKFHLIVFSNFLPKFNTMSAGRFQIRNLNYLYDRINLRDEYSKSSEVEYPKKWKYTPRKKGVKEITYDDILPIITLEKIESDDIDDRLIN